MNWKGIREQFPITKEYLFFDLANKCGLPIYSTDIIKDYISKQQQSSGSKDEWFKTIEDTRENFARLINVKPSEIAFTKNTSEGLNMAANLIPFKPGDNVIINANEHPNNIYCWLNLEKKGVEVLWLPTRDGESHIDDIKKISNKNTRAISISSVTYAPGNKNDIKAISRFCRENNIYLVVDAVQSIGTMNIDVGDLDVDFLCSSGHKAMFCPHGVGIFYCNERIMADIDPIFVARSGMGMAAQIEYEDIEYTLSKSTTGRKFEIGNYNYLGLTVLNETCKFLLNIGMENVENRILYLVDLIIKELDKLGYEVKGHKDANKASAIVCFKADNAPDLYRYLERNKVLTTLRRNMIRLSVGLYTNEEDIYNMMAILKNYTN